MKRIIINDIITMAVLTQYIDHLIHSKERNSKA